MNVAHLVTFWHDGNGWHWVMRRGLRQALEVLKLVTPKTSEPVFTFQQARIFSESDPNSLGEVPNNSLYREGAVKTVTVNKYERDQAARKKCIQHHGPICKVCEVNLVDIYGPLAAGYIHVHHLRPLADIGAEYEVDPKLDLIPVCPNCHAMLHRNNPPLSVEELRARMQEAKSFE